MPRLNAFPCFRGIRRFTSSEISTIASQTPTQVHEVEIGSLVPTYFCNPPKRLSIDAASRVIEAFGPVGLQPAHQTCQLVTGVHIMPGSCISCAGRSSASGKLFIKKGAAARLGYSTMAKQKALSQSQIVNTIVLNSKDGIGKLLR